MAGISRGICAKLLRFFLGGGGGGGAVLCRTIGTESIYGAQNVPRTQQHFLPEDFLLENIDVPLIWNTGYATISNTQTTHTCMYMYMPE